MVAEVKNFDAREKWFNSNMNLMNNTSLGHIEKGTCSYEFEFILPKNLPGSLKHEFGNTSYSVQAFVEHPL